MQERRRSWSVVRAWTSCRVQASYHVPSVALEWVATASTAVAASSGCIRNAVGSSAGQRTLITDVHGARELHAPGWQTIEGSPSRTWQAGGGSFLLLPSRHALGAVNFQSQRVKTAWKKFKELLPVLSFCHLSFKTWGRVYSSSVRSTMLHASETWPLTKPNLPTFAAKWQGNDQTDLQCQAARHCHHQIQWATCAAWHWRSGPHSEGEKAPLIWTCGMLQWSSQDSLWHTGWWKAWAWEAQDDMEAADREGLQRVEALGCRPSW